ncbi:hypothetical protein BpHYR1_004379 [Brachionus plicatilis]|uniref:Uncharacterized protein n=1 Tax=Brachionus plicatilis TaxID=10195 RepID=A0A3M7Q4W8_BRAPC|nr:hypothetical protein BpHYR1_004379 [Brachionus plicatilis]
MIIVENKHFYFCEIKMRIILILVQINHRRPVQFSRRLEHIFVKKKSTCVKPLKPKVVVLADWKVLDCRQHQSGSFR